ncbi:MAG: hypothetical protein V7L25_28350, partial [Nostoc sp.]|uniref:hypothetical protein n=1 Tax=Nostoc sp. TaxID=1180 RepID=UPI002FF2881A
IIPSRYIGEGARFQIYPQYIGDISDLCKRSTFRCGKPSGLVQSLMVETPYSPTGILRQALGRVFKL